MWFKKSLTVHGRRVPCCVVEKDCVTMREAVRHTVTPRGLWRHTMKCHVQRLLVTNTEPMLVGAVYSTLPTLDFRVFEMKKEHFIWFTELLVNPDRGLPPPNWLTEGF